MHRRITYRNISAEFHILVATLLPMTGSKIGTHTPAVDCMTAFALPFPISTLDHEKPPRVAMATIEDNPPDDPDAALLIRTGHGDDDAFAALVERWQTPLLNFFYRSLNSFETSEDLAQLTFVKIYRAAGNYVPKAKFSTYLFHVARRLLINEYRRSQRKPAESTAPEDLHAVDNDTSTREISEIEEAFEKALRNLPENHATAILLFKQQEMSYEEIAETMDASLSSVKTWIFRARQQLKEELSDFLN